MSRSEKRYEFCQNNIQVNSFQFTHFDKFYKVGFMSMAIYNFHFLVLKMVLGLYNNVLVLKNIVLVLKNKVLDPKNKVLDPKHKVLDP